MLFGFKVINTKTFLLGVLLLIFGLIYTIPSFIIWMIKLENKLKGTKTHITKDTIKYNRIIATLLIVLGIILLVLAFFD